MNFGIHAGLKTRENLREGEREKIFYQKNKCISQGTLANCLAADIAIKTRRDKLGQTDTDWIKM